MANDDKIQNQGVNSALVADRGDAPGEASAKILDSTKDESLNAALEVERQEKGGTK